ncbi:DUF11 domain-containing protein [Candidatus Acetothermia bacterium]|nr:DUF11 domain-containing protein [Candidatus Acetothermia bacterium]MBI3644291.1 DUF11 domain-containing protein [Candidatus Acetothermia bacterium]
MVRINRVVVVISAALIAGLLAIGSLGHGQSTPASALSEQQIKAGLGVLQDNGKPTPIGASNLNLSKSNINRTALGWTQPATNVSGNGPLLMTSNLNLSKSNVNRTAHDIGADEQSVGILELQRPMNPKKGQDKDKRFIPAGQYGVSLFKSVDKASPQLMMFLLDTDEPAVFGLSLEAAALTQALSDEFTDSQGIPCLLGDDYTAAILLNLLGSELEENTSALDLSLQMTLDTTLKAGQPVTFTATVTNSSGAPTTGTITVTDTLPNTLIFSSINASGFSCLTFGQQITCTTSAVLAPGQSTTIQITAQVKGGEGGVAPGTDIKNCAKVSTAGDQNQANDSSCVTATVQAP